MVRGTGKFKQKRGGGRSFSKNLVLDENGTAVAADRAKKWRGEDDSDESGSEEEEEEEEESEESEEESKEGKPEMTRAERKEWKKKQAALRAGKPSGSKGDGDDEESSDSDLINPNHVKKKMNISDLGAPGGLSRREREQKEKQEAKERYMKLHLAGKTDEAKADMNRLAKIRAEREAAQAKRKAEQEAKAAEAAAKNAAQKEKAGNK